MTVIDLGELRDEAAPGPSPRRPRSATRLYRCLAVLVVALVTLAGAAPVPGRTGAIVPGGPGAEAFLVGDRLYVLEVAHPGGGAWRRQLVAYRLTPGHQLPVLWRTSLPDGGNDVGLLERDGTVLLTGRSAENTGYETSTVDTRTGRPGWRQPGVAVVGHDAVLVQSVEDEGMTAIRRVDPSTGRTLWSVPIPATGTHLRFGPEGIDRIVLARPSGDVEVFDASSGARLIARNIRPGELPTWQRTQVVDELLLVIRDNGGSVTAYGLDGLELRWTARLSLVGYVEVCGELLCAYRQTGGMWALDPATGSTWWTDPRSQSVLRVTGGRFLVDRADATGSRYAVVEAATGRLLADLGTWEVARWADPADPVIGIRRGRDGRLLVAELDVAAGRARVRDALPDVLGDCRFGGDVLVCRRIDGRLGLWRLP
ncbi:hypothetical protein GA0070624_2481 [Micromonospora rhizosphaerae]|uniref:Pyrrolo-quinoline quinone repeat domain-containing protein n=1 Tax=Micromonospora rhizosphaerae TaxID=568872 RepID=A0A1C6RYR6_9ACTN|nr:PQQ-binding-like beta-propeller repeat protein [Micromonospora rhizosphaerae]SCL22183.1 hypothetical protein GA0070624_2481 [Micromonospora rhizosphaerae]